MNKIIATLLAIFCTASVVSAEVVEFNNLRGNVGDKWNIKVGENVLTVATATVTQLASEGHVGKWYLLVKPQFDNPEFPQPALNVSLT